MDLENNNKKITESQREDKSDWFFYFLVILIAFYIIIKTVHWPIEKSIDVLLLQQSKPIENLQTAHDTIFIADFAVDTIHFPEGEYFYHENFGYSEFKNDFFLKLQTQMETLKSGKYNFSIRSDDGFKLTIDNTVICAHPNGRPMEETLCSTTLNKGLHHFEIYYYQGFGYLGLEARYEFDSSQNPMNKSTLPNHSLNMQLIGRESETVKFHPMPIAKLYVNQ